MHMVHAAVVISQLRRGRSAGCDKLNLDIFWLKNDSLEDPDNLPEPEILAAQIVDDLQAALVAFEAIQAEAELEESPEAAGEAVAASG